MKKILLTSIAVATCGAGAFGQGSVIFGNYDQSTQPAITLAGGGTAPAGMGSGSGLVVELFWNNGTSYVLEDTYTSVFTGTGNAINGPGYFDAGLVSIAGAGTQSFYVEGFYTYNGQEYKGQTADFTATVNVLPSPPLSLDSGTWNGDILLNPVPEPSTIALGGLGAAALLLLRRRK